MLTVVLCRPGVAKGKGKEGKGKGPLGKHPISGAPKLDAALNRTDEASDASDGDSIGANSSQEAADDSSHAGASAAPHQGAPSALLMPVAWHNHKLYCHEDTITSSHDWSQKQACRLQTQGIYLSWVCKAAWQDWHKMQCRDWPAVPACFVGVKVLERLGTMQRSTRAHAGVCMLQSMITPWCIAPYPFSKSALAWWKVSAHYLAPPCWLLHTR